MKRMIYASIGYFFISAICITALPQDSLNIRLLGEVHPFINQSYDVALSGKYAFMSSGMASGLRILDLSDPSSPVEVGYAVNGDYNPDVPNWMADRVRVSGEYAAVLFFDGTFSFAHYSLVIYDVSNPIIPQPMGSISLPDHCTSLFMNGDFVYVTAYEFGGFSGVIKIDISDPADPVEIESIPTWGMPEDVFAAGDTVYIANTDSLLIFDISVPGSPEKLVSYAPPGENVLFHHVAARENAIYIIDSLFGIRILNAADFSQIQEVASFPHNQQDAYFSEISISGDRSCYLQHGDNMAKKLIMLDVSDPVAPREIGAHHMPGNWWFYGFDFNNEVACIAGGVHGLRVVDISDPGRTKEIGCYDAYGLTFGLTVSGQYAFISTNDVCDNLLVYDVTDPSSPQGVNSLTFQGRPFWISSQDNFLYVPGAEVNGMPGVSILDISNPEEPDQVTHWPCPPGNFGVPLSVERYENYAFVAMAYGGVQIYDVTQIDQPIALDSWTLWDPVTNQGFGVRNVKVSWPYLFVPDEAYGLYILDFSDPANITEAANFPTPGQAWWIDLSADGNYVYLSDFNNGFRIIDVSNPLAPDEVGFYKGNLGAVTHLRISGDSLYVTDAQGTGLHVFDVSDPANPSEVAYHKTPGVYALDITLANDLVYFLDLTHFEIFELTEGSTEAEEIQPTSPVSDFRIHSVYPNPFNETVTIQFDLYRTSQVIASFYSIDGCKVRTLFDGLYEAGRHTCIYKADLASGMYILYLNADGQVISHKMTLIK